MDKVPKDVKDSLKEFKVRLTCNKKDIKKSYIATLEGGVKHPLAASNYDFSKFALDIYLNTHHSHPDHLRQM